MKTKTPSTKKKAAQRKKTTRRKTAAPRKLSRMSASRADFGKPVDGFFARQPAHLKPVADTLRRLVEEALPDATSSIKWGMPFYTVGTGMVCAIGAHKSHVNLILSGPPDAFEDPEGRLEGSAKTGRHLKLTALDEVPRAAVRRWVQTAARLARGKG